MELISDTIDIISSKNKKPCKECPYLKGTDGETYWGLGTEASMYDGTFVHNCHLLDNYGLVDGNNLGCVGSKMWGEKLINNNLHPSLKDINELEQPLK
jgi:hypothetical protein